LRHRRGWANSDASWCSGRGRCACSRGGGGRGASLVEGAGEVTDEAWRRGGHRELAGEQRKTVIVGLRRSLQLIP
jgi:hypothetical protein